MSKNDEVDLFEIMNRGSGKQTLAAASMRTFDDTPAGRLLDSLRPKYGPVHPRRSYTDHRSAWTDDEVEILGELVGAIAPDVARMTEQQALDEMMRLDAISPRSRAQEQRLIDVELRMEQFAQFATPYVDPNTDQGWDYYKKLAEQTDRGEDPFNEKTAQKSTNIVNIDEVTVRGASNLGWILGGIAFLGLAFHKKLSPGGRRNK